MISRSPFGSTGHESGRVIFGAAAFMNGDQPPDRVWELLELARSYGINHIDTAPRYGDAEQLLAPWLTEHRHEVFLATKTFHRTRDGARADLERSLERMGVDQLDLWQMHNLVEPDEIDVAYSSGGVLEAFVEARDEGLVRFLGVTGHGVRIAAEHSRHLERFPFDSVLLPYNFTMLQLPEYRRDVEALLATCAARGIAVQTIKSVARRRYSRHEDHGPSWYEALDDDEAIGRAVRFVLANDQVFLNSTSDWRVLGAVFAAAEGGPFESPSEEAMRADVERYGMAALFDGGRFEAVVPAGAE